MLGIRSRAGATWSSLSGPFEPFEPFVHSPRSLKGSDDVVRRGKQKESSWRSKPPVSGHGISSLAVEEDRRSGWNGRRTSLTGSVHPLTVRSTEYSVQRGVLFCFVLLCLLTSHVSCLAYRRRLSRRSNGQWCQNGRRRESSAIHSSIHLLSSSSHAADGACRSGVLYTPYSVRST